jgi:hypothetical protein
MAAHKAPPTRIRDDLISQKRLRSDQATSEDPDAVITADLDLINRYWTQRWPQGVTRGGAVIRNRLSGFNRDPLRPSVCDADRRTTNTEFQ